MAIQVKMVELHLAAIPRLAVPRRYEAVREELLEVGGLLRKGLIATIHADDPAVAVDKKDLKAWLKVARQFVAEYRA